MAETAYRDVVTRVSVEPHPDNAKQFMEFAKQIAEAQKRGQKDASDAIAKALQEQRSAMQKHMGDIKQINRDMARSHEAVTQSIKRQTTIAGKANSQRINAENARLAAIKRTEDAAKKSGEAFAAQQAKQAKAYADAMRTVSEKNDIMAESAARAMTGIMSLGRGLTMVGMMGEENTEKVLKQLIKVQAFFDIMRGGIDIMIASKKAWQAYTAAIEAANAAKAIHATIHATGGAGQIGGEVAGGAAGGILKHAAPDVLGGMLGGMVVAPGWKHAAKGVGLAGRALGATGRLGLRIAARNPYGAAAIVAGGAIYSGAKYKYNQDIRKSNEAFEEHKAGLRRQRENYDRTTSQQLDALGRQNTNWQAKREWLKSTGAMQNPQVATGRVMEARANMQRAYDPRWATNTPGLHEGRMQSAQQFVDAGNDYIEVEKKRLGIVNEIQLANMKGAQEYLKACQAGIDAEKKRLDIMRQQFMSAKERFGLLKKSEQQKVLTAMDRARQGTASKEDAKLLQNYRGLSEVNELLKKMLSQWADAGGFGRVADPSKAKMDQTELAIHKAELNVKAGIQVENGITVTLKTDMNAVRKQLEEQVDRKLGPMKREIADAILRSIQSKQELADQKAMSKETAKSLAAG